MGKKRSFKEHSNASSAESAHSFEGEHVDYVVERVVDKRTHKGQLQYRIKWEGYPDADNTWEPASNLECDELVAEFEKNHKKERERRGTKELREKDKPKQRERDSDKTSTEKERKKRASVSTSEDKETPEKKRKTPISSLVDSDSSDEETKPAKDEGKAKEKRKEQKEKARKKILSSDEDESLQSKHSKEKRNTKKEQSPPKQAKVSNGNEEKNNDDVDKKRESSNSKGKKPDKDRVADKENNDDEKEDSPPANNFGFEYGNEAAQILGASDSTGALQFLIKWKNCDKATLVPASVVNVKVPQMVIAFYESRLAWNAEGE